jgi:hypothetical protein
MIMAERTGEENHKFIYKGLTSKSYHKAAKKYFDNLIYKIKNQMGAIWTIFEWFGSIYYSFILR